MSNITSTWEGIPVQVIEIKPNDVVIAHISPDMSIDECQQIFNELSKTFPDNKVIIANEHVLQKLTVFRPEDTISSIMTQVDIDRELNKIIRRGSNDFLY